MKPNKFNSQVEDVAGLLFIAAFITVILMAIFTDFKPQ